jgi:superfamily II DNA or RNA helicase
VFSPWPHQTEGVDGVIELIVAGQRRIVLTSPTRGGKSWMMFKLSEWALENLGEVLIIGNKTILVEQLFENTAGYGIDCGLVAAGYAPDLLARVQVASIQTLHKRWKKGEIQLPAAKLVLIDEVHNEKGARTVEIVNEYIASGAIVVGVTATPVGIDHIFNRIVVAGRNSDLRDCGAIVPAHTYAPDEPTLKAFKKQRAQILELRKEYRDEMLQVICGRSIEHFRRLNPDMKPSIGFPPGVQESLWFAERYWEEGIPAAHIDANRIWMNGVTMNCTTKTRALLKSASQTGEVVVVFNRFVLREGVDYPWLQHALLLCTFGSVKSYLQAGGRILGQHFVDGVPQHDRVTMQDHGGNYWRHDSLNADRVWNLGKTDSQIQGELVDNYRGGHKPEPIVCPKCSKVRYRGVVCPGCNFAYEGRKRMVIETNGRLRAVHGDIFKPRRVSKEPTLEDDWKRCVYRARNADRTMTQARAIFRHEHAGMDPSDDWMLIPRRPADWYRKARDLYPPRKKQKPEPPAPLFDSPANDPFLELLASI